MKKFLFYVCFLILFKCIISQINKTTIHLEKYSKNYLGNSNNDSKIKNKSFIEWILLEEVLLIIIIVLGVIFVLIITCILKKLYLKRLTRRIIEDVHFGLDYTEDSVLENDSLIFD